MKYKILYVFTLCMFLGTCTIYAQNEGKAKKFSGAILFGNGIYLAEPAVPGSPTANDWTIAGEAPYASGISSDNQLTNMIGAEFRYFVTDKIALRFNGSGIIRKTPAFDYVEGLTPATSEIVDPASSAGWVPNYAATVMNNTLNINVSVGGEYHFATIAKLSPFVGVTVPFCYGRNSQYDPTVIGDKITDVGSRHIETIGIGSQLIAGADYNLTESVFVGLEIKPVSYLYAYNTKYPGPGLETRSAANHTLGFFTQPVFKLGVRF